MIQVPGVENGGNVRSDLDYYREGLARGREGRHDEALTLFTLALDVNPALASAWAGRGFALGKLGRFQEEIESCDRALCIDPACIDAWNYKGFALGKLGRFEEKVECCEHALALDAQEFIGMEQQRCRPWYAGTIRGRDPVLRTCAGSADAVPLGLGEQRLCPWEAEKVQRRDILL